MKTLLEHEDGFEVCPECEGAGSMPDPFDMSSVSARRICDCCDGMGWMSDEKKVNESVENEEVDDAGFGKFMTRILKEERQVKRVDGEENNPQRLRASKVQERPLGRIRFGGK